MPQKLYMIGNTNSLVNQAANQVVPDEKVYDVGGFKFTGKAAKELGAKTGQKLSSVIGNNTTTGQVVESGVRTGINAVAPGLGNVLPTQQMLGVWESMLGQSMDKPINKYNLGDIAASVGQLLVSTFNPKTYTALLQTVGLGPPRDLGKNSNYLDPREGPKVYAPTDLFRPIVGSPNNYPQWYSGGNVIPLHSPFLAINSLNASLQDDKWEWVIGECAFRNFDELKASYNAGKLFKTASEAGVTRNPGMPLGEPIESNIWFEIWCFPKNNPDYARRKRLTDEWLVNLWQINGQPNPVITPVADRYTMAPDVDPGDFWWQLVSQKNPQYYTRWVTELAKKMGGNLQETMRKYGIDPLTGQAIVRTPAPPARQAPAPQIRTSTAPPAPAKPKADGNTPLLLVGAAALAYFAFAKK